MVSNYQRFVKEVAEVFILYSLIQNDYLSHLWFGNANQQSVKKNCLAEEESTNDYD